MIRQLAGQTAIYGISSIASRLLNYLLTPLLTRVLTTAEYGVITDMYALIPFAMVVLTMGMETGYFRFAGKAEGLAKREVFSTTWGAVSALAILFASAVLIFTPELSRLMEYADHPSYVRLVALIIALDVITAIPYARLRQEGKAKRFVAIRTFSVVLNVLIVLFLYLGLPRLAAGGGFWASLYDPSYGPGYYLVSNLITSLVTLLVLYPAYRDTVPRIRWGLLRSMLLYSFPLLVSGVAGVANMFIDRQMIKYLMPADEAMDALGIYGAVAKLGVILLLFIQMYRYAAEPFFLANFKKEDFLRANAEALKYFTMVSVGIFLLIMLFENAFVVLVGPAFRQGMSILPVILLANIFSGMTLNLNFWYKQTGDTRFAIWITGTGLVVTVVLNVLMVPVMGYVGAAWARLGCEAVMLVLSYLFNRRYYPTPYPLGRIGEYFLLGALLYGVTFLTPGLPGLLKYSLHLTLLLLYGYYALRREHIDLGALLRSVGRKRG